MTDELRPGTGPGAANGVQPRPPIAEAEIVEAAAGVPRADESEAEAVGAVEAVEAEAGPVEAETTGFETVEVDAVEAGVTGAAAVEDAPDLPDSEATGQEPVPDAGEPEPEPEPSSGVSSPDGDGSEPGLRAALEAILLVVDEPVAEVTLAQIMERPRDEVVTTLRALAAEYTAQGRGFDLREVAGGWRFYTRQECAPLVERFVRDGQQTRLTQAALETLAVVAYRQPVSRARVSAIRGVISDGVIRTLTLRGLIEEAGQDPEHQAILYQTTSYFLERLGLRSLDELPDLAPFLPEDVADLEEPQP